MAYNIELEVNLDLNDFEKFKKDFRKEIIENGLDDPISDSLDKLKQNLFYILNNQMRNEEATKNENKEEHTINIPKSDEELIKHFTGFDVKQFNKTKQYTSLEEAKIAFHTNRPRDHYKFTQDDKSGPQKRSHPYSSGVNLRIPMTQMDTFDAQYSRAVKFYNEAMFAFVNDRGEIEYYINPGIDLQRFVKVVCSTEVGDTKESRDTFESNRVEQGFADWTLKSKGVKFVKKNFTNVTEMINAAKEADYETAKKVLRAKETKQNQTKELEEKVNQLETNEELVPSVETFNKLTRLIKNLKIAKNIEDKQTIYKLVSSDSLRSLSEEDFVARFEKELSLWKIENTKEWLGKVIKKVQELIDQFENK